MTDPAAIARRVRCLAFDITADMAGLSDGDVAFTRRQTDGAGFEHVVLVDEDGAQLRLIGTGPTREAAVLELRRAVDALFPAPGAVQ